VQIGVHPHQIGKENSSCSVGVVVSFLCMAQRHRTVEEMYSTEYVNAECTEILPRDEIQQTKCKRSAGGIGSLDSGHSKNNIRNLLMYVALGGSPNAAC
jgi:hypothetical protein